jgi:transcriptional regulator with XRE-family HTH domain
VRRYITQRNSRAEKGLAVEDREVIGRRIRRAREAAGISRAELARRLKNHVNTLYLIEAGQGYPSVQLLVDLSAEIGASPADLARGTEYWDQFSPRIKRLLELADELPMASAKQ